MPSCSSAPGAHAASRGARNATPYVGHDAEHQEWVSCIRRVTCTSSPGRSEFDRLGFILQQNMHFRTSILRLLRGVRFSPFPSCAAGSHASKAQIVERLIALLRTFRGVETTSVCNPAAGCVRFARSAFTLMTTPSMPVLGPLRRACGRSQRSLGIGRRAYRSRHRSVRP